LEKLIEELNYLLENKKFSFFIFKRKKVTLKEFDGNFSINGIVNENLFV
jgi:hypothetical protein